MLTLSRGHRLWLFCLAAMLTFGLGAAPVVNGADTKKSSSKKTKKNKADLPPIELPKDAEEIVVSYDPGVGAGQEERKGEAPMFKIRANGSATFTNMADGEKKTTQLTDKEFKELLEFIVHDQEFLTLTNAMIDEDLNKAAAAAGSFTDVRGIGTSVIQVKLADKQNQLSYRAAVLYHQKMPKAKELARFAQVEKRLSDLAVKVAKSKAKPKK